MEISDAKLSTSERKKLKKSTFCGPNRSFPVPDCAHVTSAKRLIGRAKVSASTKAKILACVNRKAKSLGCKTSDADAEFEKQVQELMVSEEFEETRDLIEFLEELESKEADKELENYIKLFGCSDCG
jgi:hypothetical protein